MRLPSGISSKSFSLWRNAMRHTMKTPRQFSVLRKCCRLEVESLEARLPLGDALLGALLGSSWLGATLATFRQDPWTMANGETEARPAHPWSAQDSDLGHSPAERSSVPLALFRAGLGSDETPRSAQDS